MRNLRSKKFPCENCKKLVLIPPNRFKSFRFCSRKCAWDYKEKHERVEKKCVICGAGFTVIKARGTTAKYCSRSCYYKSGNGRGSREHSCKHCHKKFRTPPSHDRVYCSRACINKAAKEIWNPNFTTVRVTMKRRGMIEKCEHCGYNEEKAILGVHHKDEDRKNNALSNLAVLCPNCHSLAHLKHISHGGIKTP